MPPEFSLELSRPGRFYQKSYILPNYIYILLCSGIWKFSSVKSENPDIEDLLLDGITLMVFIGFIFGGAVGVSLLSLSPPAITAGAT